MYWSFVKKLKKIIKFLTALGAEILSRPTALKDRHTKLLKYQQQGIPYYLMISQDAEETEVYRLLDGKYELQLKDKLFSYRF